MAGSKTIDRVCCLALAVMLILTALVWTGKASSGKQSAIAVGYEDLFDASYVHTIDIEMDDWEGLIASATQETYTECAVTIDGEKVTNVGIRAKGNTSLSSVASMGSEKYSFKIEFDQYVKGKTYHGLDKLSLNNLIYDATGMKDYLAYTLMNRAGVPAPLCSYVQITVNGEPWGLYLAVEGVEDAFMERNNMTTGELYKPDSMSFGGGRGNGRDFDFENFRVKDEDEDGESSDASESPASAESSAAGGNSFPAQPGNADNPFGAAPGGFGGFGGQDFSGMTPPEGFQLPEGTSVSGNEASADGSSDGKTRRSFNREGFFQMGGGMFNFGMGSSDVKLQYIDDDPDSYSNIFNNAKTKIGKKDKARLIDALETLNGDNPQDAVFTDEVITYLTVHDFLQNGDSYTGMMVHNYYLYEEDGKLAILPWDYNLAFGGMGAGGDASSTINSPIDTPVSNSTGSDRPLISWIFEDEEALAAYHEAYNRFITDTVESGWLAGEITRVAELIRPYIEADKNSFYTVEQFDTAIEALQSYCALRGESVRGQLDGTIPSTSEGQRADSSTLVDTGDLSITAMGSMNNGGGGGGGMPGGGGGMPGGNSGQWPSRSGGEMPGGDSSQWPSRPDGDTTDAGSNSFSGFSRPDSGKQAGTETQTEVQAEAGTQTEATVTQPEATVAQTEAETKPETGPQTEATETSETQGSGNPFGAGGPSSFSGGQPSEGAPSGMPGGGFPGQMASADQTSSWITFGACLALLLAAILIASKIKGHNG